MSPLAHLWSLAARMFGRKHIEQDLDEELRGHIVRRADDIVQQGVSRADAERQARIEFGGPERFKEECREETSGFWLETLWRDVKFGVRMLLKNPGFTFVAILTIALGIGANTAVFSAMHAVLLSSLPLPHPEQLVYLRVPNGQPDGATNTGDSETSFSEPVFEQLRGERRAFSDLMAYVPLSESKVAVRIGEEPEEAEGDMVSGNFFSGLGVSFARGRGLTLDDETGHTPFAVLSYAYWSVRFARNPTVIGQTIYVKGVPFTIIGVTAPGFFGIEPGLSTDFWIPLQTRRELNAWGNSATDPTLYERPQWWCLRVIGRLTPGVSRTQAIAIVDPLFQSVALTGLGTPKPTDPKPVFALAPATGIQGLRDDFQKPLIILMAMVVLVLAIACGNVAMLLAARNSARQREFFMRTALGAGSHRLLRQLLTESLLLVTAGAGLGWLLAVFATRALAAWAELETPLALNSAVLAFTLGISALCALVFGLAPLRSALRIPIGLGVKGASSGAHADSKSAWAGKAIVAAQMALCLFLLVGAGLLMRSLRNYETLPLGLRTDGLLVFGTSPLNTHTDDERARFYRNLIDRLRVLPGVESGTLMENRLGSGWSNNNVYAIDGVVPQGDFSEVGMRGNDVGPDYFHALGIPMLQGRDLADSDGRTAPRVAVVNETFAKRFFANKNPLGHTVGGMNPQEVSTIIGVAADSKYTSVAEKSRPMVYFDYCQGGSISDMQVELHSLGSPESLIPGVRAALREIDPNLPMQKPMAQRAQFDESFAQARLFARLAMFFGVTAALLVATGLYGTLAYRVNLRTVEIGVRMALGAQRRQVLWMVLRESLMLSAVAMAAGLPLAFAGAHVMRSMLFGVLPADALSFAIALLGVPAVALLASFIPARRASSIEPMRALRNE